MDESSDYALALSIALAVEADADLITSLLRDDQQIQRDRELAIRLADSPEEDIELIAALLEADEQAERDHLLALRLDEDPDATLENFEMYKEKSQQYLDDETYDLLKAYNAFVDHEDEMDHTPTSSKTKECIVCREDFPETETTDAPCFHTFCRTCFVTLTNTALEDESLFPPRCCGQDISMNASHPFVTKSMIGRFKNTEVEFNTIDRTYCSDPKCSTFIAPSYIISGRGTCTLCLRQTCVKCKREAHRGLRLVDEVSQKVLDMREEKGWKRCVKCGHLIELTLGCNHIICSCGHQFCYVGGCEWKTCLCPQVDEARLYSR